MEIDIDSTLGFVLRGAVETVRCDGGRIVLADVIDGPAKRIVSSCVTGAAPKGGEKELVRIFEANASETHSLTKTGLERPTILSVEEQPENSNGARIFHIALATIDSFELLLSLYSRQKIHSTTQLCSELAEISRIAVQAIDRFMM